MECRSQCGWLRCTLQKGHRGDHYDSMEDREWGDLEADLAWEDMAADLQEELAEIMRDNEFLLRKRWGL